MDTIFWCRRIFPESFQTHFFSFWELLGTDLLWKVLPTVVCLYRVTNFLLSCSFSFILAAVIIFLGSSQVISSRRSDSETGCCGFRNPLPPGPAGGPTVSSEGSQESGHSWVESWRHAYAHANSKFLQPSSLDSFPSPDSNQLPLR